MKITKDGIARNVTVRIGRGKTNTILGENNEPTQDIKPSQIIRWNGHRVNADFSIDLLNATVRV